MEDAFVQMTLGGLSRGTFELNLVSTGDLNWRHQYSPRYRIKMLVASSNASYWKLYLANSSAIVCGLEMRELTQGQTITYDPYCGQLQHHLR